MPKQKPKKSLKKVVAVTAATAAAGLAFWASQAFYTVDRVIDGDTFVTAENRYVRLDGNIDAPEIDSCLGKESKKALERLVLNKKVFIKTNYIDDRKRMISVVYTKDGNVSEKMLAIGMAIYDNKGSSLNNKAYIKASDAARERKIGVYSEICTQSENPDNPGCNIKGNNSDAGRHYSFPGCTSYSQILVQLHMGDNWFCTEKEAKRAGFSKSGDCP